MELGSLETKFFRDILNAELDVPVRATLSFDSNSLDMIVVPQITSSGDLVLKYYNAPSADPESDFIERDTLGKSWQLGEDLGRNPLVREVWREERTVSLQLYTSPLPFQPRKNPCLAVKVLYAGLEHRGILGLDKNQVNVKDSKIAKIKFSLVGFPDFMSPERQRDSISGIDVNQLQTLRSVAERLGDGASVTLNTPSHRVILECDDGWKISIDKDKTLIRGSVSHNGLIEKNDGTEYSAEEVSDLLQALDYFLAFAAGTYCHPTVLVGYDSRGRPVWGETNRFEMDWPSPSNWFNNIDFRTGVCLEQLFPQFWLKWRAHKYEIINIIECYVHSYAMRKAGIADDAVAKSYTGLHLLSSLYQGKTSSDAKDINKTLCAYKIPNLGTGVVSRISKRLRRRKLQGPDLLHRVRNFKAHPLKKGKPVQVKQEYVEHLDSDPMEYVHLHDLSQYYLEYMFLGYCGLFFSHHRPMLEGTR